MNTPKGFACRIFGITETELQQLITDGHLKQSGKRVILPEALLEFRDRHNLKGPMTHNEAALRLNVKRRAVHNWAVKFPFTARRLEQVQADLRLVTATSVEVMERVLALEKEARDLIKLNRFRPVELSSYRGFGSLSPDKKREMASKGGRAAHEQGKAREWTADEARTAGRKGGQISRGGRGRAPVVVGNVGLL